VLETVMDLVHQGLLAERGCDFFSLTEAGRLATAAPRDLTLLSRPGCHLCTEVKARLLPLLREFRLILREVDIDRDAALRAQYSEEIPVIFLGAAEIARHSIDGNRLRQLLRKHLPS
jgi:glutaredoxin